MLALLGALKQEILPIRKKFSLEATVAAPDGCCVFQGKYDGRPVLLVQTGIGKERAETAARSILRSYPVTTIVSFGFSGALTESLKIGDIILCSALCWSDGRANSKSRQPCYSDAGLLSRALQSPQDGAVRFRQGSSVTVAQPVSGLEQKQALARLSGADIVDMESYWIARIAAEHKVPFLSVRAISDTIEDSLPPFQELLDSSGQWRWRKASLSFLFQPRNLATLFYLRQSAREAGRSLAAFADQFISSLDGGKPA